MKNIMGYISGKMTGVENYNAEAFNDAACDLAELGLFFINPITISSDIVREVEECRREMPSRYFFMRLDIVAMARCDFLYMLPDWQKSWGAKWERIIAKYVFDMPIFESLEDICKYYAIEGHISPSVDYWWRALDDYSKIG